MAQDVVRSAQGYNLLNAVLLALVFTVLGVVYWSQGWEWRIGFFSMALVGPLRIMHNYESAVYRSTQCFSRLSRVRLAEVPLAAALPLGAWWFGFAGYCGGQLTMAAGSYAIIYALRPLRTKPALHLSTLKLLLSTGWRFYVRNYVMKLTKAMPRTALVVMGSATWLGLFAPVMAMTNMFEGIALSLQAYMFPKLTARFARQKKDIGRLAIRAAILIMLAMAPLALLGAWIFPPVLRAVLPDYEEAIPAVSIALAAGVLRCGLVAQAVFPASKAWGRMYLHAGLMLAIQVACVFAGVMLAENRLVGVAWGMLVAAVLMLPPTWLLVRNAGKNMPEPTDPSEPGLDVANPGTEA